MIDPRFISQYDSFISYCILKYTKPPIDDYKQDIYLTLHTHSFHNGNIKSYIAKIVRNYFYDKFRRKKEIENPPFDVTNQSELHLFYVDTLHTIESLPGGKCLKLYSQGYKYREIAYLLSMSMSSVKSTIHRVRCKLQGNTCHSKKEIKESRKVLNRKE
jgi:DNA-directed RNA polymerase specialized sigma24 family protein